MSDLGDLDLGDLTEEQRRRVRVFYEAFMERFIKAEFTQRDREFIKAFAGRRRAAAGGYDLEGLRGLIRWQTPGPPGVFDLRALLRALAPPDRPLAQDVASFTVEGYMSGDTKAGDNTLQRFARQFLSYLEALGYGE